VGATAAVVALLVAGASAAPGAPAASERIDATHVHLLPAPSERPYFGGPIPPGSRVAWREDSGRKRLGQIVFLAGWAPAAAGSVALVVTSAVLFSQQITTVGLGALLLAPLVAVPLVGPVIGFLGFSFLTFLWPTLATVALFAAQTVGLSLWGTAKRRVLVTVEPSPPVGPSSSLAPAAGPRVTVVW